MKIGYLRVSTEDQSPQRQIDALEPICDELHIETLSAVARSRPVYDAVIKKLSAGDVFVIWDLDRAYRSAKDALNELDALRAREIDIQIASLNLDASTPHGRLVYTIISGYAEFERGFLSERTKQGMQAAKARGVRLGRPPKLTQAQVQAARRKLAAGRASLRDLAKRYDVHPWTLSRALKRLEGV